MKIPSTFAAAIMFCGCLAMPLATEAQVPYTLTKPGSAREMLAHDKDGNAIGYEVYEVTGIENCGDTVYYDMSCYMLNVNHVNDGFSPMKMRLPHYDESVSDYSFAGAIFRAVINRLAKRGSSQSSIAKSKIPVKGSLALIPDKMSVGESLKASDMTLWVKGFALNITTFNRSVLSKESVTTQAGTFECLKVQELVKFRILIFSKTIRVVTWYAPGIGEVRSEAYMNGNMNDTTPDSSSILYALR